MFFRTLILEDVNVKSDSILRRIWEMQGLTKLKQDDSEPLICLHT